MRVFIAWLFLAWSGFALAGAEASAPGGANEPLSPGMFRLTQTPEGFRVKYNVPEGRVANGSAPAGVDPASALIGTIIGNKLVNSMQNSNAEQEQQKRIPQLNELARRMPLLPLVEQSLHDRLAELKASAPADSLSVLSFAINQRFQISDDLKTLRAIAEISAFDSPAGFSGRPLFRSSYQILFDLPRDAQAKEGQATSPEHWESVPESRIRDVLAEAGRLLADTVYELNVRLGKLDRSGDFLVLTTAEREKIRGYLLASANGWSRLVDDNGNIYSLHPVRQFVLRPAKPLAADASGTTVAVANQGPGEAPVSRP